MAKNSRNAYGFGQGGPLPALNPTPVVSTRNPLPSDINFEIGTQWINKDTNNAWILTSIIAHRAHWESVSQPSTGEVPISKYIVDGDGSADYITIQEGLDAANLAVTSGAVSAASVYVRPGTYTENLICYDRVDCLAAMGQTDSAYVKIIGTHTPPLTGYSAWYGFTLEGTNAVFQSNAAGSSVIGIFNIVTQITGVGYTFDLPNWTGMLNLWGFLDNDLGTNGWVNNATGSMFVNAIFAGVGLSQRNATALINGSLVFNGMLIAPKIRLTGNATARMNMGCELLNTIELRDNATVDIQTTYFRTGAEEAINTTSSVPSQYGDGTINSTANLVINGTGTVELGSVNFSNNSTIASTVNVVNFPTLNTPMTGWNGSILETQNITVTSDGAIITFSIDKSGGGNLTLVTSNGFFDYDTTPAATIALTAGSDSSPQLNFVYWLESTRTLTVNTSSFPNTEHVPLATVLCQSAASLQTDAAYKVHVWTDHVISDDNQGHISHINSWIRNQNARWMDGVNQTFTITPQGGSADNVILSTASGTVLQLHDHIYPAFAPSIDYYVINDSVTPYTIVNDLNALLTDSTGASMTGKFFSLVIWGVVSEDSSESKIFVNLPSGSYNNATSVTADALKFANFSIPSEFIGTGFLIAQWNLRHQNAAGGTWTSIDEVDLRGLFPGVSAGAGSTASSEFIDNVFRILDEGDNTKEVAFEASGITTATTRTLTVPDADGTIALTTDAEVVQQERIQFSTYVSTAAVIPFDNTIPQNTEGVALTSINFTPTNVNNILVFEFAGTATGAAAIGVTFSLFEAAIANAIYATTDTASGTSHMLHPNFRFSKVAGTVALTNYALRWGATGAVTVFLNGDIGTALYGGVLTTSFTITEYKV
jgi:hypothetical protein